MVAPDADRKGAMAMKLSVIIPVYNSARYLEVALESVLTQSLTDFELIAVDNGSDDDSPQILREVAARDGRVKILTIPKSNAGTARNAGMKLAVGEYVYFMDADDLVLPGAFRLAYDIALQEDADVVVFGADEYDDKTHWKTRMRLRLNEKLQDAYRLCSFSTAPWNKIYRLDYIRRRRISFQEISRTNDLAFVCEALCCTDKIAIVDRSLYLYRINNGSSLQATKMKSPTTFIEALEELKRRLESAGVFERFALSFERLGRNMVETNIYSSGSFAVHRELVRELSSRGYCVRGSSSRLGYQLARVMTSIRYRGFWNFIKHAVGRLCR